MIYLDYNATTPLDPIVRKKLFHCLEEDFGNPSSPYRLGKEAAAAMSEARAHVASLLGASPTEIVFNSGATESIATAFLSALQAVPHKRHIITSSVEHPATLKLCNYYEQQGYEVTYLPVDHEGLLLPEAVEAAITPSTSLVSLLWANNETGVLFPIEKIALLTQERGIALHVDAAQAVGKKEIDLAQVPLQYLSFSGHKLYASSGIGALYVQRYASYTPLIAGSQEGGRRGGTENRSGAIALGEAALVAKNHLPQERTRQQKLLTQFEEGIFKNIEKVRRNGNIFHRLSNTTNLCFEGIQAAEVLLLLDQKGLYCSAGAACHAASLKPSHVLTAMGRTPAEARASLRFSLGRFTTEKEIEEALSILIPIIKKLRLLSKG